MARFSSIKFQPNRPLLREISASRLNAIVEETRRNKPLAGRGTTLRQTGQGVCIDLTATPKKGGGTSAKPLPWDIVLRQDPANPEDPEALIAPVMPGTISGYIADNWNDEFPVQVGSVYYAKAVISTDGVNIISVSIDIDTSAATNQTAQLYGVATTVEYPFGMITDEGVAQRLIGTDTPTVNPETWIILPKDSPAAPGESPYDIYYRMQ